MLNAVVAELSIYSCSIYESSVWRALRRETQSNRESMRPLWFFHLYIFKCAYLYISIFIYRYDYGDSRIKKGDDIKDIIMELLNQSTECTSSILDRSQPYIQEFILRHCNQPSIVTYLTQTMKDVERFCTTDWGSCPFVVDMTFNINEYYFT